MTVANGDQAESKFDQLERRFDFELSRFKKLDDNVHRQEQALHNYMQ